MSEAFIVRRGGGNQLDFKINIYSSESALLADAPNKVTIGVVTTTAVSSVSIQASTPSNPASGKVWIADTASKWQAPYHRTTLRKSGPSIDMEIYPCFCKQYISGAWWPLNAYLYKGGAWTQFSATNIVLYDAGTDNSGVTGGWGTKTAGYTDVNKVVFNADSMLVKGQNNNSFACAYTNNDIDLAPFSQLVVTASASSADAKYVSCGVLNVAPSSIAYNATNGMPANLAAYSAFSNGVATVDISALSSGKIAIGAMAVGGGTYTVTVTKVELR